MAYCEKCNRTGLIPFVKNGRVIPNAFIDCECKLRHLEQDHYQPLTPADFDFACSSTWRGHYQEQYGNTYDRMIERDYRERPLEPVVIQAESLPWDQRQQYQVDQMRGELINVRDKLAEMINRKKKPVLPKHTGYKGLVVNNEQDAER